MADQLLFKAGNKTIGTDLQIISLCLAAFKCNTLVKSLVINCNRICIFSRTILNRYQSRVALQNTVKFFLNVFLGCLMKIDRKSTRLTSSHANISYAVF